MSDSTDFDPAQLASDDPATFTELEGERMTEEGDPSLPETDEAAESTPPPEPLYTFADLRLEALDRAVARDPQVAINLLLRGELYLTLNRIDAAQADFTQAITLASAESESLTWGYANSAVIDRAEDGLREIAHRPAALRDPSVRSQ